MPWKLKYKAKNSILCERLVPPGSKKTWLDYQWCFRNQIADKINYDRLESFYVKLRLFRC